MKRSNSKYKAEVITDSFVFWLTVLDRCVWAGGLGSLRFWLLAVFESLMCQALPRDDCSGDVRFVACADASSSEEQPQPVVEPEDPRLKVTISKSYKYLGGVPQP